MNGSKLTCLAGAAFIASALVGLPVIGPAAARTVGGGACGDAVIVSPGDTFYRIAARCGTNAEALMRANPAVDPRALRIGMHIRMPGGEVAPPGPAGPTYGDRYRVRQGDTLSAIARELGISLSLLIGANPDIDARYLVPGIEIIVPGHDGRPGRNHGDRRRVTVTGTVIRRGIECPALRGDDGRLYTLAGAERRFRRGDRIQVQGRITRSSICHDGTTIDVERVRVARDGDDQDSDRTLTVTGTLTSEGAECPALRGDNGRLYTLAGDTRRFRPGDRVQVQGERAQASFCMQGTTIVVDRIRSAG